MQRGANRVAARARAAGAVSFSSMVACGGLASDGSLQSSVERPPEAPVARSSDDDDRAWMSEGRRRRGPRRGMMPNAGGAPSLPPPASVPPPSSAGGAPPGEVAVGGAASMVPTSPDAAPASNPCSSMLELTGTWRNEAARVSLTFRSGASSTIQFGDASSVPARHPTTGAPVESFWTLGVDECCPDPATTYDDWRWPPGIEPPSRCALVTNPAADSCSTVEESALPIEGEVYTLEETCGPAGAEGTITPGLDRRWFQFQPTQAWADFCGRAESVRCADVVADTGGDFCEAEFICNHRYDGLDQISDFCAWYRVCSCDEQGCTTDERIAWSYALVPGQNPGELHATLWLVQASTPAVIFESVSFMLRRVD